MRARQIITELFDRAEADHVEVLYSGTQETEYKVYAGGYVYRLKIEDWNRTGLWDVSFTLMGKEDDEDKWEDDTFGSFEVQRTGQQFVAFPAILGLLQKWMSVRKNIKGIQFFAKEESRQRLYRAMARRFAPKLGMTVEELPSSSGGTRFILRRSVQA